MRATQLQALPVLAALLLSTAACDDWLNDPDSPVIGTTPGWFDGEVVTFEYTRQFFCRQPPSSAAPSECEVGADAERRPTSGTTPVLHVLVPLFTPAPPAAELHCPTAGNCVAHPASIDLGRVLGPGASNIPLPAHSHVIGSRTTGGPRWYEVQVVGITSPAVWNEIVAARSLTRVRQLQTIGVGITDDLPGNLFLRFRVR